MSRAGAVVVASGFIVVIGAVACAGATPIVQERPGNPDDNVCIPCATEAQWNRPGKNPCPCAEAPSAANTPKDDGVLPD